MADRERKIYTRDGTGMTEKGKSRKSKIKDCSLRSKGMGEGGGQNTSTEIPKKDTSKVE